MPPRSLKSMNVSGPKSLRRAHQPINVTRSPASVERKAPHECVRLRFPRFSIIDCQWSVVGGQLSYYSQLTTDNWRVSKQDRSPVDINRLPIDSTSILRSQQQGEGRDFFRGDHSVLRVHAPDGLKRVFSRPAGFVHIVLKPP